MINIISGILIEFKLISTQIDRLHKRATRRNLVRSETLLGGARADSTPRTKNGARKGRVAQDHARQSDRQGGQGRH